MGRRCYPVYSDRFNRFFLGCQTRSPEGHDRPKPTLDPLVMSLDGKGIVMRREDLREATKRAAEREQHKLKTRLSRGEKRNRKRMATVAAIYIIERHVRGAESIMGIKAE